MSKGKLLLALACALPACRQDMHDQARVDANEESPIFPGETANMLPPAGTVAQGALNEDGLLAYGAENGQPATEFPFPVTLELMQRGQVRFDVYCSPCHGLTGRGDGPVIQRGFFPRIANLQEDRLRFVAVGYLFGVVTNGFNAMPSYGAQIPVRDRWAILAYLRALQYSQHPDPADVPAELRQKAKEAQP
jgi:mono/diheme cytochrome c family protein